MDKAPAYGAGDSGFESQYGLCLFFLEPIRLFLFVLSCSVHFFWFMIDPNEHQASVGVDVVGVDEKNSQQKEGVMRESNSRPPAPEAGIIPLDHMDCTHIP